MLNEKRILIVIGIIVSISIIFFVTSSYYSNKESFSVDTILLKINLPLGGELVNNIKITNNEKSSQDFKIYLNNLENIAFLLDNNFKLGFEQSKKVKIFLKDIKNEVKIYSGQLIIKSIKSEKKIPIIIGIEDKNPFFAIIQNSIPKYDKVNPGSKLGIEIKIFNLQDISLHNVKVKYSIENLEGESIFSEEENLVIKESISMSKIINLPKNLNYGNYLFVTSIDYKDSKSMAGYLFEVVKKEKGVFSGEFKFFLILIIFFILGILALFFYFIKTKEEVLIQLKKQQQEELYKNLELINNSKKQIEDLKNSFERRKKIRELFNVRRTIIKNIKVKQKRQRREVKKLSKQNKKNEMNKKMDLWKKQGYKMIDTKKEMKNQLENWKKQGYDSSFLKVKRYKK